MVDLTKAFETMRMLREPGSVARFKRQPNPARDFLLVLFQSEWQIGQKNRINCRMLGEQTRRKPKFRQREARFYSMIEKAYRKNKLDAWTGGGESG